MNDNLAQKNEAVLVVGGGIGGMQSALLLAEAGHHVYLLDVSPGIGGSLHLLDRTFPTDSCGICHMLPGRASYCPTIECQIHPNIELLPYAELLSLEGEPGNFTARIWRKPRYVSIERCTECGLCAGVCPEERPGPYEGNLDPQKAIYRPPLRAVPGAYVIDMETCTRCGECVAVCPTEAIDLDMEAQADEVQVGAVILSPGFEPFDARGKGEYGFGHYDNVLDSIQFERMLSLSGSTGAHIVRPSDGRTPERIAFIQCVGSRDVSIGRGYCSSVCCMYNAKQVKVAKELEPDLQVDVFYMDIRAHGKNYDEYFDAVEALPGVTYRRSMVSSVHQLQQSRDLLITFIGEDGELHEEQFDMVVLPVGFGPPEGVQELGRNLDVTLNAYGFGITNPFQPDASTRPGVFVTGAFREPKDIPETVVEASSAAASAARLLRGGARIEPPAGDGEEERDVSREWPRVGVFIGDRWGELEAALDLKGLADYVRSLRNVEAVRVVEGGFDEEGREAIVKAIQEEQLNRVVLAGYTDLSLQPDFQRMMEQAGLNPNLLERVNLGSEVARAHEADEEVLTSKARRLVEMAVSGAARRRPFLPVSEELGQRALVIGGGLAGITAALTLADMGHPVDLVERSDTLGGQLRQVRIMPGGEDPEAALTALIEALRDTPRIGVHLETEVQDVSGRLGMFQATLAPAEGEPEQVTYGAVIVATGGREITPTEYLYGEDERVLTQRELETALSDPAAETLDDVNNVVMIQCVGSREPERPYCSRVCCTKAVTNALALKKRYPEARISVLYRDMRTYGFREDLYREARERGVAFLHYELEDKPQVTAGKDCLEVRVTDALTGQEMVLPADRVVLSTGIEPFENQPLAETLGVQVGPHGFFQEEHPKMRPLDFTQRGIYVCGLAHSPRAADETIAMAQGAAMRAASLLAPGRVEAQPTVAQVNARLCSACGLCVEACPYDARVLEPGDAYAQVLATVCQGCGVCVAICPNKASQQTGFTARRVYDMLDALTVGE